MKKKFQYTCKNCGNKQIIELDIHSYSVYKIICKKCGNIRVISNQTGILRTTSRNTDSVYGNQKYSKQTKNLSSIKKNKIYNTLNGNILQWIFDKWSEATDIFLDIWFLLKGKIGLLFVVILLIFSLGFISLGIFTIGSLLFFNEDNYLLQLNQNQPNIIYDRNGKILAELFDVKIGNLKYSEIPEDLKEILLFVEDENFFSHGGIDYIALIRAMYKNILSLRFVQGASTITQQLSRILLNQREKTITRKIKEAILAYKLESLYTKEQILTFYMNHVYLGHGAYGFQNASLFYFKKNIQELNFTEKLLLSCLPSRPEFYSPLRNYDNLEKKMDWVYQRMQEENLKIIISKKEYQKQKEEIKKILNRSPYETVFGNRIDYAPYVTEFVRTKIEQIFGKDYVVSRGLKIYTTIDLDLQKSASEETLKHLKEIRIFHPYKYNLEDKIFLNRFYLERAIGSIFFGLPVPSLERKQLETASIGLNPRTGEILYMQGGSEFQPNNQYNRVLQMRRQTGSAIKPIIYSAGIEDGILNPATIFEDKPLYFSLQQQNKEYWLPENIDETYEGRISLREALEKSRNIPALMAGQKIGLDRLEVQFRKFFFHSEEQFIKRFKRELAISIGILEMSPLEMAVAYSAFANNGIIKRPYLIQKIEDSTGNVIYSGIDKDEFNLNMPEEKKVLNGDVAEVMISLLKSSAKNGGTKKGGFYSERLAGKTGTTNQYRDAWFIGLLPELVIAVWIGFDEPRVSMNKGTGSGVSGPLYGKIVKNVKEKYDNGEYFFEPRAILYKICPDSGKIPGPYCPRVKEEIFTNDGLPREICDFHTEVESTKKHSDFE